MPTSEISVQHQSQKTSSIETPSAKSGHGMFDYDQGGFYCEMFGQAGQEAHHTQKIIQRLKSMDITELMKRHEEAEKELYNLGITFTVYSENEAIDRILPFDVVPRILSAKEWQHIETGSIQRVTALNLFLKDIYHDQKILKDGIIPKDLILGHENFRPEMMHVHVPKDCYVHIAGIDIVRGDDGHFMVLEDNARCPSGVSYVVENRQMMMRAFSDLLEDIHVAPVDSYGPRLQDALVHIAPKEVKKPQVVLLSPGTFNSAYFEHIFLAREMGIPLVEGQDLIVENDHVFMRTTAGLAPVHSIYRRISDEFLDPTVFNKDSVLGVPGLMQAYAKGNVALANAVGTGVADDKAVYAYMPRIIKYYLDQDPILSNVETHICREPEGLQYTLDHLEDLVVKPVGEAGGYGIVIGPRASQDELADMRAKLLDDPANYISQPMIRLSVCPTLIDGHVEPRHVDLRPFVITAEKSWVLPGGLSRVALRKGSLVVNSSQGGGSKDTWVLKED